MEITTNIRNTTTPMRFVIGYSTNLITLNFTENNQIKIEVINETIKSLSLKMSDKMTNSEHTNTQTVKTC